METQTIVHMMDPYQFLMLLLYSLTIVIWLTEHLVPRDVTVHFVEDVSSSSEEEEEEETDDEKGDDVVSEEEDDGDVSEDDDTTPVVESDIKKEEVSREITKRVFEAYGMSDK